MRKWINWALVKICQPSDYFQSVGITLKYIWLLLIWLSRGPSIWAYLIKSIQRFAVWKFWQTSWVIYDALLKSKMQVVYRSSMPLLASNTSSDSDLSTNCLTAPQSGCLVVIRIAGSSSFSITRDYSYLYSQLPGIFLHGSFLFHPEWWLGSYKSLSHYLINSFTFLWSYHCYAQITVFPWY